MQIKNFPWELVFDHPKWILQPVLKTIWPKMEAKYECPYFICHTYNGKIMEMSHRKNGHFLKPRTVGHIWQRT